ncbi:MAG: preprotein translocase subunit YajC [Chthoniobacteraceae bacterium]|nr:preprotein translocase subunit YajC [Chthoniobacteraceae bacterium]
MIDSFFVTLADAAAQQQQSPSSFVILQLVALAAIFYFLLIRPQQKRQKEQAALIASVKTGDKVVTNSGIHGIVANVKDTTVIVKVADNVKIEFDKAAVAAIVKPTTPEA